MKTILEVVFGTLLLGGGLLLGASLHYQKMTIAAFDSKPLTGLVTRVELTGYVTYKAKEDDGDLHLRVCDSPSVKTMDLSHCFVAEVMPDLPVAGSASVKVGMEITVDGISRYDGEHKWRELHPVERLTILGGKRAGS